MKEQTPETLVADIPNLGPRCSERLAEIGVLTRGDLVKMGPIEAYKKLKENDPKMVNILFLYAMVSGLEGIPWNEIPQGMKEDLRRKVES